MPSAVILNSSLSSNKVIRTKFSRNTWGQEKATNKREEDLWIHCKLLGGYLKNTFPREIIMRIYKDELGGGKRGGIPRILQISSPLG